MSTSAKREQAARLAGAALLVSAVSIATSSVLARRAYDYGSTPETAAVLRMAVPAVVFGTWLGVIAWRVGTPRLRASALLLMVAYGLLLLVVNVLELKALERVQVAVVILVIALVPLWISLASWMVWRTPVGARGVLALGAALGGTALVVGTPSGGIDGLGLLFGFATSLLSAGFYLLVERGLTGELPQLVLTVGAFAASAVALAVEPAALSDELGGGGPRAGLVLGAGLGVTATLLLTLVAVRHSSAFVAGVAVACEPIFAGALCGLALALRQFAAAPSGPDVSRS